MLVVPQRLSQAEHRELQLVTWVGSSGQLGVLRGPEHTRVFAGVEAHGKDNQCGLVHHKMSEWVVQVGCSGGRNTYLRIGQLEAVWTGQHLYDTAWEVLPASVERCSEEQGRENMVYSNTEEKRLLDAARETPSIGVTHLEEVCGGVRSAGVLWCWLGGDTVPGSVLRAV